MIKNDINNVLLYYVLIESNLVSYYTSTVAIADRKHRVLHYDVSLAP